MLAYLSSRLTAAHLAIAAVAPLVLCERLGSGVATEVLPWLAVLVAIWAFMAPAINDGERSYAARSRVVNAMLGDSFFWVSLLLLAYVASVTFNGGVMLAYDCQTQTWGLASPRAASLPGGVSGIGGFQLSVTLLAVVLYPALAYAIGDWLVLDFSIFTVVAIALDAVLAGTLGGGIAGEQAVSYGLWSLIAVGVMGSSQCLGFFVREFVLAMGLTGCFSALICSGHPLILFTFAGAILLLLLLYVLLSFSHVGWRGSLRMVVLVLGSMALSAWLFNWYSGDWNSLVPGTDSAVDAVLYRLAGEAWLEYPWAGVGAGAFPLFAKLQATAEELSVLGPFPDFRRMGLLMLLVERGMVGVLAIVAAIGALAFVWIRRVFLGERKPILAANLMMPVGVVAVLVSVFLDGRGFQADAIVAFAVIAAASVNGGT